MTNGKAVLEARGEAYSPEQRAGTLIGDIQDDVKASISSAPIDSPAFYDGETLRTLYLRFPDEDLVCSTERILSHRC